VDRKTGTVRWRKPLRSQLLELMEQGLMANPQFRQILGWQLAEASWADRKTGTLTTDGSRVFLVSNDEAPDGFGSPSPWGFDRDFLKGWRDHWLSCCQLRALDAKT